MLRGLIKKLGGHAVGREFAHKLSYIPRTRFSLEPRFKAKPRLVLSSPELGSNSYPLVFVCAHLAGSYW